MRDDYEVDALTRRRFLKLSCMAGAATALAGASPVGWRNLAQAAASDPDCGDPGDTSFLWSKVQECIAKPSGTCLEVDSAHGCAVLHGGSQSPQDFLLVPTTRIKGIECPKIWQPGARNYWPIAWQKSLAYVRPSGSATRALGINSVSARTEDQLHIHMAAILPQATKDLENNDKSIKTATLKTWKNSLVMIAGYSYRVIHLPDLANNLFALLKNNVATNDMRDQILVVTPRGKGGFYILNSQGALPHGTSTCDRLLMYR